MKILPLSLSLSLSPFVCCYHTSYMLKSPKLNFWLGCFRFAQGTIARVVMCSTLVAFQGGLELCVILADVMPPPPRDTGCPVLPSLGVGFEAVKLLEFSIRVGRSMAKHPRGVHSTCAYPQELPLPTLTMTPPTPQYPPCCIQRPFFIFCYFCFGVGESFNLSRRRCCWIMTS